MSDDNSMDVRSLYKSVISNEKNLIRHSEHLKIVNNRLGNIEKNQEKMADAINGISVKINDGYDTAIKSTNDRTTNIAKSIDRLEKQAVTKEELKLTVEVAMSRYENRLLLQKIHDGNEDKRNKLTASQWLKSHRLEILTTIAAICMVASTLYTIFSNHSGATP